MSGPVDWSKQGTPGGYGEQPSHPTSQQGYGQPPQPGGYGAVQVPPTNAGWAVAATLFFWPLAFSAWNASSNVVRLWVMGDHAGSREASEQARRMGKIALWIGIGFFVAIVILYAVIFAVLISSGDFETTTTSVR